MWAANKTEKGFRNGQAFVRVDYKNDTNDFLEEVYTTSVIVAGWPDDIIQDKLTQLNAISLASISLGAPGAATVQPVKSQDEVDREQFRALLQDWQDKKRALEAATKAGVTTKLTQQDVSDAETAWKAAYKDDFARYLEGLF